MTQELLDGSVISDVSWYLLALPIYSWCVSKSQGRSGDNPFHVLSLSLFSSWYNDTIDIVKVSIDGGTPIAAEFIVQHPI